MARNNGGFILIKINKATEGIIADDFDIKLFREILAKNIKKPLILETSNECFVFSHIGFTPGSLVYTLRDIVLDEGNIDGATQVVLAYDTTTDAITWSYTSY